MLIHRALKGAAIAGAVVLLSLSFAGTARAQCGPMDVVFVVDNSGSMTDVISEIQNQVTKIADAVQNASGGDYQFGLVAMPQNDVDIYLDLSPNNRALLDPAVKRMTTVSSSGAGIAYDEALDTILNHLPERTGSVGAQHGTFKGTFRPNAAKIIMVITDTGPQGFDSDLGTHDQHTHAMALLAKSLDIHITGIFVPTGGGTDPSIDKPIMVDMVATSGGLFKETKPDASDLSDVILDIVAACGGASGGVIRNLLIDPLELVLLNGQSGDVHIVNFNPSTKDAKVVYTADIPEENDFTAKFTPVAHPADPGTEEETMTVTVGPRALQGTHLMAIRASKGTGADDFAIVHVIVDCVPPYFLSNGQPQNVSVPRGQTTTLKVTPSGDGPFRYQWFRGHSGITTFPIAGATLQQLTSDPATGSGEYWVRVDNACGSRDSTTVVVTPQ
jgi:VWA domain-containing protein